MKPVWNKRIITQDSAPTHYKCVECGEIDNVKAYYSEMEYGEAVVVDTEGNLEDFEGTESDQFQVTGYECRGCSKEESYLSDLIVECDEDGRTYSQRE